VQFKEVSSGLEVLARDTVPANACIISCPFSLAITSEVSKNALLSLLKSPPSLDKWTERQLICSYLSLHWVVGDSDSSALPPDLVHLPYINILPAADKLRTALHFTQHELDGFKGTNLYGATCDRRRDWEAEWKGCKELVEHTNKDWAIGFTWERYLTAATYLSSRAFPSTILSSTPSLRTANSSHPILLPGIDCLNHAPSVAVSWIIGPSRSTAASALISPSSTKNSNLAVNLVLHTLTKAGGEMFNNYGPKPNSELILGYGFAICRNPSDTIVLQIGVGGTHTSQEERKKFEIGRDASGANLLWEEVLILDAPSSGTTENTYDDYLRGAEKLGHMVFQLLDNLPKVRRTEFHENMKSTSDPQDMLRYYVEGQRDILQALLEFASEKERAAAETALAEGIELVFEEDEIIEGEETDEGQYDDA